MKRTTQQNKALHLYCDMVAKALNDEGITMNVVIEKLNNHGIETPCTMTVVKEFIWKRIQKAMTGQESTTEPTKQDYPHIYETVSRTIGELWGVHVPWPSEETMERNL